MEHQNVFAVIEQLEKEYIRMWQDICTIESPTTSKEGVGTCMHFVIRRYRENENYNS